MQHGTSSMSPIKACSQMPNLLSSGQECLVSESLGHWLHIVCNNLGSRLDALLTELLCCWVGAGSCSCCWLQKLLSQVMCHWLCILLNSLQTPKACCCQLVTTPKSGDICDQHTGSVEYQSVSNAADIGCRLNTSPAETHLGRLIT